MYKRILATILLICGFVLPSAASAAGYVIQYGDTLSGIARRFDTTVDALVSGNGIADPDRIFAGDALDIPSDEAVLGAGYTPVTGYQSRTTSYISAAATTIPVASTRDKAGNQISLSSISASSTVRVFMSLETGTSKEEIVYCTGVTVSSWTGCVRGLSFQGGDATASSTLAFAHNAGSSIIITDVGQFFSEFVDMSSSQTIFGTKTFNTLPKATSTTAVPSNAAELATKYYVDNVGAGGFTASNVSTTRGLSVDGSVPEKVGVNASTTAGLAFDASGKLYVNADSAGGVTFTGSGGVKVDTTDNFSFTGTVTATTLRVPTTPTDRYDAVSLEYYRNRTAEFTATTTAGSAVTAGKALYMTVTSTVNHTDTSTNTTTFAFIGLANASASAADEVTYTRPGGINCSQSGLTPGVDYYLSGSGGAISPTPNDTRQARIGTAVSANCIQVLAPKYVYTGTTTTGTAANGSTFRISTGFYPANFEATAGVAGDYAYSTASRAGAIGLNMNTGSSGRVRVTTGLYVQDETGSCLWRGDISSDIYGMTVTNNNYSGAGCGTMLDMSILYRISN